MDKNQSERGGVDRARKANPKTPTLNLESSGRPVVDRKARRGFGLRFAGIRGALQSQRHEHLARHAGLDRRATPCLQQPAADPVPTRQRRNVDARLETFGN